MADGNSTTSNKRRRMEDDETESVEIKKHDRLWFTDGNVILRCAQTDYRVHQSLLAAHSEVFRDMFAVATPGDRADDDVPVVHLSDDPDGLAILLLFLFFHEEDFDTMGWVLDLLEIASKYIVPLARDKCLDVLRRLFPNTLQKYQERETHSERYKMALDNAMRCHMLATNNNLVLCLPGIRLFCVDLFVWYTFGKDYDPYAPVPHCPPSLQVELLFWKQRLLAAKRDHLDKHIREFLQDSNRELNYHCADELAIAFLSYNVEEFPAHSDMRYENDLDLFAEFSFAVGLCKRQEDLCHNCMAQWREKEMAGREALWEELPRYLSLGTWEELRAKDENSQPAQASIESN